MMCLPSRLLKKRQFGVTPLKWVTAAFTMVRIWNTRDPSMITNYESVRELRMMSGAKIL